MRVLIDAYNLLHAVGRLRGKARLWPGELEGARRHLLILLARRYGPEATRITAVFDARAGTAGQRGDQNFQGIQVRFAPPGQIADDLIEDLIRGHANPRQLTADSDDRRVRDAARRRHCEIAHCLDYYETLLHPPTTPDPAPASHEEERPDRVAPDEVDRWAAYLDVSLDDSDEMGT